MTAIQRFAIHGTIMNPHSNGPYVRHENHLAAMQGRCLAQIEEPATLAGTTIEQYARMFNAACEALGEVSDCLGINSDINPGAEPIIAAIEQLRAGAAPAAVAGPADELAELAMLNKLIELGAKASYAHAKSNSDDGPAGTAAYVQWQELRAEMGELIRAHVAPALEAPADPVAGEWQLVPTNPTVAMAKAYDNACFSDYFRSSGYKAMLAAAPQAQAHEAPAAPATPAQVQALHRARRALHAIGKTYDDSELRTRALEADEEIDRMLAAWPQAPAAPSDAQLLSEWDRVSGITKATERRLACMRAVLKRWGSAAPAAPAVDAPVKILSQAARDVLAERRRQVEAEGYEPEADEMYQSGELARAAATYALLATGDDGWRVEDNWPWGMSTLKRAEPRRMLEKAGALILADMERLDRVAAQAAAKGAA